MEECLGWYNTEYTEKKNVPFLKDNATTASFSTWKVEAVNLNYKIKSPNKRYVWNFQPNLLIRKSF